MPAIALAEGTWHYQVKVEMGAQQMSLKTSTSIQDGGDSWTVTDLLETPQGNATDTTTLEKKSLTLQKRNVKQGPVAIYLNATGDKATGTFSANGQDRPIAADLGGPLFADGAGADQVLACLPLAQGYSTSFRNFDLQAQKVKLFQLTVVGMEKITVPAGTFDALRVDVTSADGGTDKKTLWIASNSHKVVKISAVVASMGGAIMTEELVN